MFIDVTNEIKRRKRKIECVMDEVHPKKTSKMSEMNEYHLESQSQKLKIEIRKSKTKHPWLQCMVALAVLALSDVTEQVLE